MEIDQGAFDESLLDQGQYNLKAIEDVLRVGSVVERFMERVRNNELDLKADQGIMTKFIHFVTVKEVWGQAQNLVPEFRFDFLRLSKHDMTPRDGPYAMLNEVLRLLKDNGRLPCLTPRKNPMSIEQRLIARRFKAETEFLLTGGDGYKVRPEGRQEGERILSDVLEMSERSRARDVGAEEDEGEIL
ncbi:uncharacterized protein KY384_002670 [Bacidia gigantensis]|uniref:uncharacterized protein n=1 Tax=Bacidia gigantensis TaxID=2732470 RepID=UPI001D046B9D|nr:uncharacterized protein KY384_002670 [Bacidia gigantensis]KAG8532792.1 hypothetical protein KY384_002670 [Bacidia gigantensis]